MVRPRVLQLVAYDLKQNSKAVLQTSTLFGAKLGVIGLGLLSKAIQTRALTPELYGLYAFFTTLTAFTALFFRFGYFTSLKVLLANTHDKRRQQEYYGLGLIAGLAIGGLYGLFVFGISFGIDPFFGISFGGTLRALAPLCVVFPMQHLLQDLTIGSNKINQMSAYEVGAKVLFILPLSLLFFLDQLTLFQILWLNTRTALLAMAAVFWQLRPSLRHWRRRLRELRSKQRSYGRHYYAGNLANQTTYKLDELLISYVINTTQLGFYSLANMLCAPMVMMSQALSNALFKDFASRSRIPPKLFVYNTLWLLACVGGLALLSPLIVKWFFGTDYNLVASYILPLSVAYFFQGLYQPFAFLSAKSWGRAVRNVSLAESVINVVGNVVLILLYGVYGVILTSIAAKLTHFLGLYYYYRQYQAQVSANQYE